MTSLQAQQAPTRATGFLQSLISINPVVQFRFRAGSIGLFGGRCSASCSTHGLPLQHGGDASGNTYALEDLYIANQEEGLLQLDITGAVELDDHWSPSGPPAALVRCIDAWNDQMWVASGGVDETWTSMYHKYGLYGLNGTQWKWIPPSEGENDIAGINDVMVVSIDPTNPNHAFFGTWEEGLIEVLDGTLIETYNTTNSTLQSANFGGSPRIGVGGVDFDAWGNLWFTNAYVAEPLQVRLADGTFIAMDIGNAMGNPTGGWATFWPLEMDTSGASCRGIKGCLCTTPTKLLETPQTTTGVCSLTQSIKEVCLRMTSIPSKRISMERFGLGQQPDRVWSTCPVAFLMFRTPTPLHRKF